MRDMVDGRWYLHAKPRVELNEEGPVFGAMD